MLDACKRSNPGDDGTPSVCKSGGFINPGSIGLIADVDRRTVLDRPSRDGDLV